MRQRHMVSKWCWENGTLGLLHFELPHILELWKMQHLPHSKGKHSKTRPALYCSLGSGVVRTKSQLSSLPPTHTHTHTQQQQQQHTESFSNQMLLVSHLPDYELQFSPFIPSYLSTLSFLPNCLLFSLCSFNVDCQETWATNSALCCLSWWV